MITNLVLQKQVAILDYQVHGNLKIKDLSGQICPLFKKLILKEYIKLLLDDIIFGSSSTSKK